MHIFVTLAIANRMSCRPTVKSSTETLIFIARVSMQCMQSAILFYQACLSVCPSVACILCVNQWTYRVYSNITPGVYHSSFLRTIAVTKFQWEPPN